MSRSKKAKRTLKRQPVKTVGLQKTEQDFLEAPAKLVAQINKETATHTQKENKLKNALQKSKVQVKKSAARVKAALKAKHTSAGKKLLTAAKREHADTVQTQTDLSKQLQETSRMLDILAAKAAKLTALGKLLNRFEKEWAKDSKKAKAKSKAKHKAKKSRAVSKKVLQAPVETNLPSTDNVALDAPTEIAA